MTAITVRSLSVAIFVATALTTGRSIADESVQHRPRETDCWQMRALDTFGGAFSLAYDLNDRGQVVGVAHTSDGASKSFITAPNGGALTAIDPPETFTNLVATSVNNAGQVIGTMNRINGPGVGFITDPGGVNVRPTIRSAQPKDINDTGQTLWEFIYPIRAVVGLSEQPPESDGVGLIEVNVLPNVDPAERFLQSRALNDAGQVALTAYRSPIVPNDPGTPPAAYRWSLAEGPIMLAPDADYSLSYNINDAGQVVGIVNRGGVDQGFVTRRFSTQLDLLGSPGDGNYPVAINNFSQIAGTYFLPDGSSHGYVTAPFRVQRPIRIASLQEVARDGWSMVEPQAINNRGQVTGYGIINDTTRAFLLTPLSPVAFVSRPDGSQPRCYR
jgi:uncharacterized membrane protein